MAKLGVVIMGQNCEKFIDMALESVKDADWIVYCDGGSTDNTIQILKKFDYGINKMDSSIGYANPNCFKFAENFVVIKNEYNQEDKGMNGKQRNFYLDYVKNHYLEDWVICLDADEIVEDLNALKKFIQKADKEIYCVKMRHLIGDLAHEDITQQIHWVPNRLFKITNELMYPETEHPVLNSLIPKQFGLTQDTTIWHLAYIPNMWDIKRRYENHLKKSEIHDSQFLNWWYKSHLFGTYPRKEFNPVELPKELLNKFGIDKEELYFANRQIELKHFIDCLQWKEYFNMSDKKILDVGCGLGPRVFALNHYGYNCEGIDISKWAVEHSSLQGKIWQCDILKCFEKDRIYPKKRDYNLVIAYDILEHIDYENINKAIENLIMLSNKNILISVPFPDNPNYFKDLTHKICEDREWWIKKFTDKGCKLIPTPDHFIFKEQILIFEVIYGGMEKQI